MADTKVSGLSAAASFLSTHELPVNEAGTSKKVTGLQILQAGDGGTMTNGYAQITANVGPFTAQADITGLTVTVTPMAAGRRIRLSCSVQVGSTVLNDILRIFLMEGATQLNTADICIAGSASAAPVMVLSAILQPTNAAHTYKVQLQRVSGTGTVTAFASGTAPAFIHAEDIGV